MSLILKSDDPACVPLGLLASGETYIRPDFSNQVYMVLREINGVPHMRPQKPECMYVVNLVTGTVLSELRSIDVQRVDLESTIVRK